MEVLCIYVTYSLVVVSLEVRILTPKYSPFPILCGQIVLYSAQ